MMLQSKAPFPPPGPAVSYSDAFTKLTNSGWTVINEGPSGAQLKHARVMRTSTKVILGVGLVGILFGGLGLILVFAALVDYYALTKERTHFLSRESPYMPPIAERQKLHRSTKVLIGVLLVLIVIGVIMSASK